MNAPLEKTFFASFFGLIGVVLVRAGLKEILLVRRRRAHLVRLPATVVSVRKEREQRLRESGSTSDTGIRLKYFPVVVFTTPEGRRLEFRSEAGESFHLRRGIGGSLHEPESKWCSGQQVEVFYDPGGVLSPRLVGEGSLANIGIAMFAAGLLTIGMVIAMCLFIGPKAPK